MLLIFNSLSTDRWWLSPQITFWNSWFFYSSYQPAIYFSLLRPVRSWLLRASFIVDSAKCHWCVYLFCPSLNTLMDKCNLSWWLTPIDLLCANNITIFLKTPTKKKNLNTKNLRNFELKIFCCFKGCHSTLNWCFLMDINT